MIDTNKTLGEILSDKRIAKIAPDAIRNLDLSQQELWNKTLTQLKQDHFGGDLTAGFETLFRTAENRRWYFSLYNDEECAQETDREGTSIVWLPSDKDGAADKPYILLVPGGGFVNVWNLTEGWPVAAQFNRLGYNVFILTYRVDCKSGTLDREMEDFASAVRLIRANRKLFNVNWERYITCGFSAGGYLVCLWNVLEKGYASYGLPKPQATIPVYPVTSWKLCKKDGAHNAENDLRLFGTDIETASNSPFEIPDHTEGFPPCLVLN